MRRPTCAIVHVCFMGICAACVSCQCWGDISPHEDRAKVIDIRQRLAIADVDRLVGRKITIQGPTNYFIAIDCCAVIGSNLTFCVYQLREGWPPGLPALAEVRVTGILGKRKLLNDPILNEAGQTMSSTGQPGEQYTIEHPRWEPVNPGVTLQPKVYPLARYNRLIEYLATDYEPMVGRAVTVEGAAMDGAEGSRFGGYVSSLGGGERVFVEGVGRWPPGHETQVVRVTGVLTLRHDAAWAVLGPYGETVIRFDGPRFLITNPTYVFFDVPKGLSE